MKPQDDLSRAKLNLNSPNFTILITGSRGWIDRRSVWTPLDRVLSHYGTLLVRNGKARDGADDLVSTWTAQKKGHGVTEDPHYANWRAHGNQAGFIRNGEMVRAFPRADIVMVWALPCEKNARWCPPGLHPTHGTADCVQQARDAGLRVRFSPQGMSW